MCEANVYVMNKNVEELLLERVDTIIPKDREIYLENIFGERKTIEARIKELHLVDHKIILERFEKG
ncbi:MULTISPECIES: CooT family nickel-binding protein [Pelosinus]|uniref:RNA-binding protein n=1 Tax=Pelosinus fermentans B4 TaxID=1149862 RepID=I8RE43_9FIRM|nr:MULTISPECIES: CooT family nickel-binding protein [Pelosinus]MBP2659214.1 RNA-binding protein [Bacillota bacterium]OAM92153.1 RNA-binding protein [Pelosinus fermentans DSM 17108]EIW17598.1 RNA-binding protein [Pelosinus fermentans B4]EIW23335.1 RNA-binding protein [Pelosinus fermentans A11]SDQ35028.1 Predicted RNA-binding protein [Pelosinus fermentans]